MYVYIAAASNQEQTLEACSFISWTVDSPYLFYKELNRSLAKHHWRLSIKFIIMWCLIHNCNAPYFYE